jgi:exodeoxyribonuclease VII large subunit
MAFNREPVIRAIQAMRLPVVTALGHTSDRTLADLVADREARTPTAAAELVVPRKQDLLRQLAERHDRLRRGAGMLLLAREQALTRRLAATPVLQDPLRLLVLPAQQEVSQRQQALERLEHEAIARRRERLDDVIRHLARLGPLDVLRQRFGGLEDRRVRWRRLLDQLDAARRRDQERVQDLRSRLQSSLDRTLRELNGAVRSRAQRLRSLGTQETLDRGFAICRDLEGRVVRDGQQVAAGQPVSVTLSRGTLDCLVETVRS